LGLLGILVAVGAGAFIFWAGKNPEGAGALLPLHSESTKRAKTIAPSKAEWMQAVAQASARQGGTNGMLPGFGSLAISKDALFRAVGQPTGVQMVGSDALLYWECSDGTVQVATPVGMYSYGGQIVGRINLY
jgi:hypothetical protein